MKFAIRKINGERVVAIQKGGRILRHLWCKVEESGDMSRVFYYCHLDTPDYPVQIGYKHTDRVVALFEKLKDEKTSGIK